MHGLGLGCLVSRRSRDLPTSRLGLGAERLGLGLGLEGLVHIPANFSISFVTNAVPSTHKLLELHRAENFVISRY